MPFREHCKVRAEWWIKINIDQSRAVAHPNIKRTLPMVTAEAPVLLDLDLLPKRLGGGVTSRHWLCAAMDPLPPLPLFDALPKSSACDMPSQMAECIGLTSPSS